MPRLIPALVGLVALVLVVPSAAQVGSGKIVYSAFNSGLIAVNPDGSGQTILRSRGLRPVWSPDGSKLAGIQDRYPLGPELFVINADGSGDHVVAESQQPADLDIGAQAWSPDGSRVAYYADGSIFTVRAEGGDTRLVTSATRNFAPAWSPDGRLLAYTSPDFFIDVIAPDGSGRRQLTDGYFPVWSPNGDSIAFVRNGPGLWVMGSDGTHRRQLTDRYLTGRPAWSPDGRQIMFSGLEEHSNTANVFVVNADGTNLRRLTRFAAAEHEAGALGPTWSPDGDQILFGDRYRRLFRMNLDGSCLDTVVSLDSDSMWDWAWQPVPFGPPLGERSCRAIGLDYGLTYFAGAIRLQVTVRNEGTEPLADAQLAMSTDNRLDLDLPASSRASCELVRHRVSCSTRLDRGQSFVVSIDAKPRVHSRIPMNPLIEQIGLHATAPGTLLPTGRENQVAEIYSTRCSASDPGRGRIDGWFLADHICGRQGRDLIHPGEGRDVVEAGAGNDVVYANHDHWARDRISCGPGRDLVVADPRDRVAKDCERVVRR